MAVAPKALAKKRGPKPIPISDEQRQMIKHLSAAGTKQDVIARILGISVDTLARRFKAEMDLGREEADAVIAAKLFEKAASGDLGSIVWYEKTRTRWRETTRHEHSGIDGKPIELMDMSAYSDEDLAIIERAAALFAGSVAGEPSTDPR